MLQAALIRFFDIIFSAFAIVVLFPFMIPIMIALKLTGEHYIFYLQPRVGKGGKDFMVLKFATMLKDSPNLPGGVLTQKNDPRILPMGKFLRKTKINELPQLANIFIGQMSVVGPRPQARQHYELYSDAVKREIDKIPPGLSGIASIASSLPTKANLKSGGCGTAPLPTTSKSSSSPSSCSLRPTAGSIKNGSKTYHPCPRNCKQ